jgi:hypothetical protein
VQDAYFDYDKSDIRPDARDALTTDAAALKTIFTDYPDSIVVEGHCDERGSAEYNLGLGDRRATAAGRSILVVGEQGLPLRHRIAEPRRLADLFVKEPRLGGRAAPRDRRQGIPGATRGFRRSSENHQLRQGAPGVHRIRGILLAEEPARPFLTGAVG